jgi:hypothetical protein
VPPEKQIIPLGSADAPASWTLPPAFSIIPEVVYAMYDGSGAAGDYIPTLEIISDSGHVIGKIPMDNSVAAGSSVEATWAPFLRSGGGGGAAFSGLKFAHMAGENSTFADTGSNLAFVDLTSPSLVTNDTTTFSATTSGGVGVLSINAVGSYALFGSVNFDTATVPAAGSFVQTFMTGGAIGAEWIEAGYYGQWAKFSGTDWEAGATFASLAFVESPSHPPPQFIFLQAGQNAGHAVVMNGYLTCIALGTSLPV